MSGHPRPQASLQAKIDAYTDAIRVVAHARDELQRRLHTLHPNRALTAAIKDMSKRLTDIQAGALA